MCRLKVKGWGKYVIQLLIKKLEATTTRVREVHYIMRKRVNSLSHSIPKFVCTKQ